MARIDLALNGHSLLTYELKGEATRRSAWYQSRNHPEELILTEYGEPVIKKLRQGGGAKHRTYTAFVNTPDGLYTIAANVTTGWDVTRPSWCATVKIISRKAKDAKELSGCSHCGSLFTETTIDLVHDEPVCPDCRKAGVA